MTDRYILQTHSHVLGQREPETKPYKPYLHKSQHVCDTLKEACRALFFYDQRMYFRDVAWDHGFCSHIVSQQLLSANKGLLFQQYAIDKYATPELPAGLYLYPNPKAGSLQKIWRQTGYDLSAFEKKGPNGEILLLATKASIHIPDTYETLFLRRILKRSQNMLSLKPKGISR